MPPDHAVELGDFFFQAKDGIRDGHVTGVQTCALPIFRTRREYLRRRSSILAARSSSVARARLRSFSTASASRSEERRVGKGCRSRSRLVGVMEYACLLCEPRARV